MLEETKMYRKSVYMDNKRQKVLLITESISQNSPFSIVRQKNMKDNLNDLPNEILFCIFDYLLPIDIVRAFEYDLQRYGSLITQHFLVHGFDLLKIKSNDWHLIPICLSLIEQQSLSICTRDCYLSTVLKSVPSPSTLTVIIDTPFEKSFLSTIQHKSIICDKLIIEFTPSCDRQMNEIDIIPLLSSSVNTLILRNVVFLLGESTSNYICETLQHIRCMLKSENDLHEILIRFPLLISIDIRLISRDISQLSTVLPLPKYFRIEYPNETILNLDRFPEDTQYYDQTVYSLPWFKTNSSLILRSCNPQNYLNNFPHPLPHIRQLTIECTLEPWSFEFVTFLHHTFPNTRTLYAIQQYDNENLVMTAMTANDRRNGKCTLDRPYHKLPLDMITRPGVRFLNINRVYN